MYSIYMHISPDGKKYIGVTKQQPKKRWKNGLGYLKNKYFTNDIIKYGWDNFKHLIIKQTPNKNEAYMLEEKLIKINNTTNKINGYNISTGGKYSRNGLEDLHYNIKENNPASKPIICVELNISFETMTDAKEIMNVDVSAITKCCKGKRKTAGGYHWAYK